MKKQRERYTKMSEKYLNIQGQLCAESEKNNLLNTSLKMINQENNELKRELEEYRKLKPLLENLTQTYKQIHPIKGIFPICVFKISTNLNLYQTVFLNLLS